MFTKLTNRNKQDVQNNICINAGEMLKTSSFHTNSRAETIAPLINCVIDDFGFALQFIDVMNLQYPLLHFSHVVYSRSGSDLCCWAAKGLVE